MHQHEIAQIYAYTTCMLFDMVCMYVTFYMLAVA